MQRLIGLYKFERARSAYKTLGDLLLCALPQLPSDVIIIPVPTASAHVRERGYDHMALLARYVAKRRHAVYAHSLNRVTGTTQRHSSARKRDSQAKQAFAIAGKVVPGVPYLLIDDVVTTGATVKYATQVLLDAGASQVWVAVVARQTLNE